MLESPTSEKPFGCPANHVWRGGFAMGWLKRASHEVLEDETHNGWVAAFWKICVSRHFFAFFVGLRTPPSWTDPWLNTLKSKWACSWLWRRQIGSVPTTTSIQPCLPQRHQRPGERTRADVRTRIHLNVWQEQAEKNKQTTLARCEAAKHVFPCLTFYSLGFISLISVISGYLPIWGLLCFKDLERTCMGGKLKLVWVHDFDPVSTKTG